MSTSDSNINAACEMLTIERLKNTVTSMQSEINQLKAQLGDAEKELSWYADKMNWGELGQDYDDWYKAQSQDVGKRARAYLRKYPKKEGQNNG